MSTLIANLPSYEVWVRKEYLTDHKSGHGEFVEEIQVHLEPRDQRGETHENDSNRAG